MTTIKTGSMYVVLQTTPRVTYILNRGAPDIYIKFGDDRIDSIITSDAQGAKQTYPIGENPSKIVYKDNDGIIRYELIGGVELVHKDGGEIVVRYPYTGIPQQIKNIYNYYFVDVMGIKNIAMENRVSGLFYILATNNEWRVASIRVGQFCIDIEYSEAAIKIIIDDVDIINILHTLSYLNGEFIGAQYTHSLNNGDLLLWCGLTNTLSIMPADGIPYYYCDGNMELVRRCI